MLLDSKQFEGRQLWQVRTWLLFEDGSSSIAASVLQTTILVMIVFSTGLILAQSVTECRYAVRRRAAHRNFRWCRTSSCQHVNRRAIPCSRRPAGESARSGSSHSKTADHPLLCSGCYLHRRVQRRVHLPDARLARDDRPSCVHYQRSQLDRSHRHPAVLHRPHHLSNCWWFEWWKGPSSPP